MIIEKNCLYCNNTFSASSKELKRGNAKFCSKKCSSDFRKGIKITSHIHNATCKSCNTTFHIKQSRIKKSKSGYFFCSRKCKDKAQSIYGPISIKEIMPSHFGNAKIPDYRKICFEHYEQKCNKCGFDEIPQIIQVHHKDRNRNNNDISNLEPLCPNCHEKEHFLNSDGKWKCKNGA